MLDDFWAGYISGAAGIIIGNPLDILKVRLQVSPRSLSPISPSFLKKFTSIPKNLTVGSAAPIISYGGLNALLFVTYNRTITTLNSNPPGIPVSMWKIFLAGNLSGLATWVVSTPTELVKCKAQACTSPSGVNCWGTTRSIFRTEGIRGLYLGGTVTALRDSIGYGFYFWTYELTTRLLSRPSEEKCSPVYATKVLLCGGIAGVASWASVFPLDVIKTRVQTQGPEIRTVSFLDGRVIKQRIRTYTIMQNAYKTEGPRVFFRGLTICSVRAFLVNAAQWAVYEWVKRSQASG